MLYPTHVEDTLTAFLQLANVDIPDSTAQQLVSAQGELLTRCYRKAKELPYVTLQHLARLGAMYATQLGQWFQRVADVRFPHIHSLAGSLRPNSSVGVYSSTVKSFSRQRLNLPTKHRTATWLPILAAS